MNVSELTAELTFATIVSVRDNKVKKSMRAYDNKT